MRRPLLILPAIPVALLLVASFVAVRTFLNEDALRARLEAQVQRATGRALTIGGPIRVGWSFSPAIKASDIGLANPPGFSRPLMAHIDRMTVRVALLPLLLNHVEIKRLALDSPDILLERGPGGQPNWVFTKPAAPPVTAAPAAPSGDGERADVQFGDVELNDAKIAWQGPVTLTASATRLKYDGRTGQVTGALELRGTAFALSGTAGPARDGPWPLNLHLDGGGVKLAATGTSANAALSLTAADLAALSPLVERRLPPIQNVRLAATLFRGGLGGFELTTGAGHADGLTVQQVKATAPTLTGKLDVDARVMIAALPVTATIHVESVAALLGDAGPAPASEGNPPLTAHLATNDAELDAKGSFTAPGNGTLALTGRAGDLGAIGQRAQIALPRLQNLEFETVATFSPETVALNGLKLTSALADLEGNLFLGRFPRPTARGALTSTHLDLDGMAPAPLPVRDDAPPEPSPTALTQAPQVDRAARPLIPDTPLPFATLGIADADLQLHLATVTWRRGTYNDVALHLVLANGKLLLDPARLSVGGNTLSARVQAEATAQTVSVKIDAPGLPAVAALALLGDQAKVTGTVDLHADLKGQGASWHALAATLQGRAGLAMVDGEIENAWLLEHRWLLGPLQETLQAAGLPLESAGDSKIRCLAIRGEADSGRVALRALTLDSAKLKLDGTGEVNLADETLDLHLRPTLRLAAPFSAPVEVSGRLRAPKARLDPGALATGRVGILIGGPPPADTCAPALAVARDGQPGPPPPPLTPAANRPLKPADLLRSLIR